MSMNNAENVQVSKLILTHFLEEPHGRRLLKPLLVGGDCYIPHWLATTMILTLIVVGLGTSCPATITMPVC